MDNKKIYIGSTIIIVIILGIIGTKRDTNVISLKSNNVSEIINIAETQPEDEPISTETENSNIIVYITGEVNSSGVYSLAPDSRVIDVVNLAGGLTEDADTTKFNLSKKIQDEEHIIIYAIGEDTPVSTSINGNESKLININTSSKEALKTLPGIGDVTADNIIKYREENNGFKNIEELQNVRRIGNVTFDKIKDYITINGG